VLNRTEINLNSSHNFKGWKLRPNLIKICQYSKQDFHIQRQFKPRHSGQ